MLLIHKQLEKLGCEIRRVATDALVLKHQDINITNAAQYLLHVP